MKLSLYQLARRVNDAQVLLSGDPNRIARRFKNKIVGRALGPAWKKLWR